MVAVEEPVARFRMCFADRIGWGYKRKRNVKGDSRGFDLSNWVNNSVTYRDRKPWKRNRVWGGGGRVAVKRKDSPEFILDMLSC